jgi:hypothetical protein
MAADPAPSRNYPPTYSSRKAPWYDPFHLFTDKKVVPASKTESRPLPTTHSELPPGPTGSPAWKWYGYGTPLPGGGPLAAPPAPVNLHNNWHTATGATPGAVPMGQLGGTGPGVVPDPFPTTRYIPQEQYVPTETKFADDGPSLPPTAGLPASPTPDASWGPAPASIRPPTLDQAVSSDDPAAPPARLRAPIRDDGTTPAGPTLGTPVPSATPSSAPPAESPDIPVVPAPGIVAPTRTGGVSKADSAITVRGRAPDVDPTALIRQACGKEARLMDVAPAGPQRLVVRLAGRPDATRAAIGRLSRVTELAGWRIDVELVTALRP